MVGAIAEHARRHGDFAVVSVAAAGRRAADGTWPSLRVALGGVADRAILVERASALLTGSRLEADIVRRAGEACVEASDPPSDVRASADYRRHLIPIYLERVVDLLRTRATGPGAGDGGGAARGTT